MKKIILAAICCVTIGFGSAMAQDQQEERGGRGKRGGQEMVQLADTSITNHMNLTAPQLAKIAELNADFKAQVEANSGKKEKGKKLSKEEREAQRVQMEASKSEGRKQLREILGTELYIEYLEKALDRRPMMSGPRGQMGNGGQRGNRGQRMQRSRDFGNDNFGGGFGGGDF